VERARRKEIQNNHTATHLLHFALQQVLGSHLKQAGSLVEDKRLRFDFNHHKALTKEELCRIEDLVNNQIREDYLVNVYELAYDEAQKQSDIKQFFGEKYGSIVRVIDIECSKELCGGTHTSRVGTIGFFKIAKESSIAAGVRRIEAMTGHYAEELVRHGEDLLHHIASLLKAPVTGALERIEQLLEENRTLQQEVKALKKGQLKELASKLLASKEQLGTIALIAQEVELPLEDLPPFAEELMHHLKSGVVALGAKHQDRCQLLVQVSSDLAQKNVSAGALIKEAAVLIQGGGGGKQTLAQAGGKHPQGLGQALARIKQLLEQCAKPV
jgi:alanyl-tRNA synthetase